MSRSSSQRFEFRDFCLDFGEKTLSHNGTAVPITPKVFEMLLVFVENPGHLLEKDELMEQIWPGRVVEESNLTFNIKMLRKALGDNANKPQFIETIQSRGYRFLADVRRVEAKTNGAGPALNGDAGRIDDDSSIGPAISSAPAILRERAPFVIAGLGVITLAIIGLGYYLYSAKGLKLPRSTPSIAVLPVKPIDTANASDIYQLGIAESLIAKLNSMKGVVVRPLSSVRGYTNPGLDPLAAGKEQQVDFVLESNYQLAGGEMRITGQLINVANGQIVETYRSEKHAADIFAMEDGIANDLGSMVAARFSAGYSGPPAGKGTSNQEAYKLYLQAMFLQSKRTPDDLRKAIEYLDQAIDLDPQYAKAWAGLSQAHRALGNLESLNLESESRKAIESVNKALSLDDTIAEAHSALCDSKMSYEWDFIGADRECKRAIELDPNSSGAHLMYSRFLNGQGRFNEAISEVEAAVDLEPSSLVNQRNYGVSLYYARRYPEAIAQLKRVVERDKGFVTTYNWLAASLEMQGNEPEAYEYWIRLKESGKTDPLEIQSYKDAYSSRGWPGLMEERARLCDLASMKPDYKGVFFQGAVEHAKAGHCDRAFDYLERSFQKHEVWITLLKVEPGLDSLHGDPRFDDLVRRIGL